MLLISWPIFWINYVVIIMSTIAFLRYQANLIFLIILYRMLSTLFVVTLCCDFSPILFVETFLPILFWRDFLSRLFVETFRRDFLSSLLVETFCRDFFSRLFVEIFLPIHFCRDFFFETFTVKERIDPMTLPSSYLVSFARTDSRTEIWRFANQFVGQSSEKLDRFTIVNFFSHVKRVTFWNCDH